MNPRARILRRAALEIEAADTWWRVHRADVPDALADELRAALARITELPGLGTLVTGVGPGDNRRLLLRMCGYHLYYRLRGDVVEVLRFWHTSRGRPPRL